MKTPGINHSKFFYRELPSEISYKLPRDYVSYYRQKLGEAGYRKTCEEHALPDNFESMEYMEFLSQRRNLMAQMVRKAYRRLCD